MGWAKLDDRRADNRKLLRAGLEARGLDEAMICWSAGHETDGYLPEDAVAMIAAGHRCKAWRKIAAVLVREGRWETAPGGWTIHDYLEFNPSRAQRDAERVRKRTAGHLGGVRSGEARTKQPASEPGEAQTKQAASEETNQPGSEPANSRPDPSRKSSSSSLRDTPPPATEPVAAAAKAPPDIVHQALGMIADRHMANTRTPIANVAAYRRSAIDGLTRDHAEPLALIDPAAFGTPEQLADYLEPPPVRQSTDPTETAQAAQRALAARSDTPPCPTCDQTGGDGWLETTDNQGALTVARCPDCANTNTST